MGLLHLEALSTGWMRQTFTFSYDEGRLRLYNGTRFLSDQETRLELIWRTLKTLWRTLQS